MDLSTADKNLTESDITSRFLEDRTEITEVHAAINVDRIFGQLKEDADEFIEDIALRKFMGKLSEYSTRHTPLRLAQSADASGNWSES
ncbi:hypothetical protein ACIP79_41810 [Streptomyces sp. NPDC088747]|uniref:hypothetical protein n=1 Tax=Streptomyces sp. NPDC088747 TaxID=3365886 RepID=UPI00380AC991